MRRKWAISLQTAIENCHPIDAAAIMSAALEQMCVGTPLPTLRNTMREADDWAALATPDERKAYCLASFDMMTAAHQVAFIEYVCRRAAA